MNEAPHNTVTITRQSAGQVPVSVAGEIDILSAPRLRTALDEALSDGARVVKVDFSRVEFCDCYGLGVLLAARHRAREQGAALSVVGVTSPLVRRLLRGTGTAAALQEPPARWAVRKVHITSERSG